MRSTKAPSKCIRFCLKTDIFSSGLAYHPHGKKKTVTENASFRKRSLEWRFLRTLPSRLRVDEQKRVFSNRMMSKIISFSFVSMFWCGRAKTIRMRYVWTRIISKTDVLRFQKYPDTCEWGSKYVGDSSLTL